MENWTVLIYANGNNELEPEVYGRFTELINQDINHKYNIIVQIGRADLDLVKSLRFNTLIYTKQQWSGVRRYKIDNKKALLLEDMGKANMADPSSLVDFVSWGINTHPDSRIMVIISGHGAGFVGVMTDYTKETPYMMDSTGLTRSLYKIKNNTKKSIDCLVLDACFMNMVEVWNEIALITNKPVKYLLTPSRNIELKGLSYINIIKNIGSKLTLHKSLVDTTKSINASHAKEKLLLVKMSGRFFNKLKKEINYISEFIVQKNISLRMLLDKWCLTKPVEPLISILDLIKIINDEYPRDWRRKKPIEKILNNIIVHPSISTLHHRLNIGPCLYLPLHPRQYLELRYYYEILSFSKNNSWIKVIGGELPAPMEIPINYVVANIMDINKDITFEEIWEIMKDFGWYKTRD
ncbi:MAG: clostripain-related cysteine peptidase [Tissierellaceae bacterium]|nr:clostripain-related cysteine peptidase [Tissierellaceae bacterium]